MKFLYLMLMATVVWTGGLLSALGEETFNPQPLELQRYEHIWKQSPFVVETPVVQKSDGLEQRFVLTGMASMNSVPVIFLLDRQSLSRIMVVSGGKDNPQDIQLVSLQTNPDPRLASATIRKGSEQGTVRYDPAALQVAAASPPAKPGTPAEPASSPPVPAASPVAGSTPAPAAPVPVKFIRRPPINLTP